MHIPDGFLDPKVSGGLAGAAAVVLGYCFSKVKQAVTAVVPQVALAAAGKGAHSLAFGSRRVMTKFGESQLMRMAAVASLIFAAQMFNFPIAGGTSGHLIGGVLAVVLLGPFAGALSIAAVLIVQSLFYADGGLMALGANIINMAVFGALISYYVYFWLSKILTEWLSVMIAAWLSVILAALACALEIGLADTIAFSTVVPAMIKVHAVIGIAEALITIALLNLFRQLMPAKDSPQ
ncbi:MAG: energy-coupling factor ABC transporter permease [Candidatus Margulisbacteria bacterium]|nr:energy-coupling factor ABC transporter permease [Candidatus Margulisiibacteriota bacterium]